jgi:hypothetical protein
MGIVTENWKNGNNKFIHIFDNVIYLLSINKNRINQGAKKNCRTALRNFTEANCRTVCGKTKFWSRALGWGFEMKGKPRELWEEN